MTLFGLFVYLAGALVLASSESQLDNVPDANDVSLLQANLEFQHAPIQPWFGPTHFPTGAPTESPTSYSLHKAGQCAGPEVWTNKNDLGVQGCYDLVMNDSRCAKDYFTYVARNPAGSRNCGCKGPGNLTIRTRKCEVSDIYVVQQAAEPSDPPGYTKVGSNGMCTDNALTNWNEGIEVGRWPRSSQEAAQACADRCDATEGCYGFVYWPAGAGGSCDRCCRTYRACDTIRNNNHHEYMHSHAFVKATPAPTPGADLRGEFSPPWNDNPDTVTDWDAWCAFEMNEGCYACANKEGAGTLCTSECAAAGC